MIFYEHSDLHLLHCTWLGCIRSCMEDLNHGFLASCWFVDNRFVSLDNPFEAIMHYLLIRGVTSLRNQDEVPMMSALLCTITHWIGPTVNHNIRILGSHDFTKILYCIVSQPWENTELVPKLAMTLTYEWNPKVIIYFL